MGRFAEQIRRLMNWNREHAEDLSEYESGTRSLKITNAAGEVVNDTAREIQFIKDRISKNEELIEAYKKQDG